MTTQSFWGASSPNDFGDLWWGDFTAALYGPSTGQGYTPPPTPPHGPPPAFQQVVFDTGLITYVLTGSV